MSEVEQVRELFLLECAPNLPQYGKFPRTAIATLLQEIDRLKAGDFTPEELQNLCHKFSQEDACVFAEGCVDYNRSLFGNKICLQIIPGKSTNEQQETTSRFLQNLERSEKIQAEFHKNKGWADDKDKDTS